MSEEKLREIFKNNSNCYADTWMFDKKTGEHIEGSVIMAMDEDRFTEVVNQILNSSKKTSV